jgi:hypothetical protein
MQDEEAEATEFSQWFSAADRSWGEGYTEEEMRQAFEAGQLKPGSEAPVRLQAQRYLEAVYGEGVWFKAPEMFANVLERWIWSVAGGHELSLGEECMKAIEQKMAQVRSARG